MSTPAVCYCGHARDAHELGVGACYLGAGPCVCGRFLMLERRAEPRVTLAARFPAQAREAGSRELACYCGRVAGMHAYDAGRCVARLAPREGHTVGAARATVEATAGPTYNPPTPASWSLVTKNGWQEGYIYSARVPPMEGASRLAIVDNASLPYARLMADAPTLLRMLRKVLTTRLEAPDEDSSHVLLHELEDALKPHEGFEP